MAVAPRGAWRGAVRGHLRAGAWKCVLLLMLALAHGGTAAAATSSAPRRALLAEPDGLNDDGSAAMDCTCMCCDDAACALRRYGLLAAGAATACTPDACRSAHAFCADAGAPNDSAVVTATFGTGLEDTTGVGFARAGAVYTPSTNVAVNLNITHEVCAVETALAAGDWGAVRTIYTRGRFALDPTVPPNTPLQSLALAAFDGSRLSVNTAYEAYYGSVAWVDDFATPAMLGEGEWRAAAAAAARAEAVEKACQDMILLTASLNSLHEALVKATIKSWGEAVHMWDQGWAYYVGRDPHCAPYGRADARAANFGTTADDGTTALVNVQVLALMVGGQADLLEENYGGAQSAYIEILARVRLTYMQGALRYAHLVDEDRAAAATAALAEHRTEGGAFWRVVAPFVAEAEPAGAAAVAQAFDLRYALHPGAGTSYYYCLVHRTVTAALPQMAGHATAADLGQLEGAPEAEAACAGWAAAPPAPPVAEADGDGAEAAAPDCACACCLPGSCPRLQQRYFHAGAPERCSLDACRERFYECPDHGAHSAGGEVYVTFIDCVCECSSGEGGDQEKEGATTTLSGYSAADAAQCNAAGCRAEVAACADAATVRARYTPGGGARAVPEGVMIAVGVIAGILSATCCCGTLALAVQRRRGYRWKRMDDEVMENELFAAAAVENGLASPHQGSPHPGVAPEAAKTAAAAVD